MNDMLIVGWVFYVDCDCIDENWDKMIKLFEFKIKIMILFILGIQLKLIFYLS